MAGAYAFRTSSPVVVVEEEAVAVRVAVVVVVVVVVMVMVMRVVRVVIKTLSIVRSWRIH
jgi:hypothetical protein